MDYTLLKTIENPPFYMFPTQRHNALPKNPHIDYVNPGVGLIAKTYSVYVPIFGNSFPYPLTKKSNEESDVELTKDINESAIVQEGRGDDLKNETEADNKLNESNINNEDLLLSDNKKSNLNLPKKRLSSAIHDAFMHPKIKTAKLTIRPTKNEQKSNVKHNFTVV